MELKAWLKELGALMKVHQTALSDYWKHYVDTVNLCDYLPAKPISTFVDDIRDWVTGQIDHTLGRSKTTFLTLFRHGVRQFLADAPGGDYHHLTVDQFLSDPEHWARSGTSDAKRLRVVREGKDYYARKSKWASALAMSLPELRQLFWERRKQRNKAVQKRELGKVRAIVAGDLGTYLNMVYVGRYLTAKLSRHPNTTLFYTAEQQADLWARMRDDSQDSTTVKAPLDQDSFDHQVNKDMIDIVNIELRDFVSQSRFPELVEVMDHVMFRLDGGDVRVGDVIIKYEKGILSGWAWTALYDTIINAAELYAMREWAQRAVGPITLLDLNVQGDDDRLKLQDYTSAVAIWASYIEADFKINPRKFFLRTDCDEYLRQVAWRGSVAGYPARACSSLVWRNPVSREPAPGEERTQEMVSSWNTFFNRSTRTSWDIAFKDIANSNRLSAAKVREIAASPALAGGWGLTERKPLPWLGIDKAHSTPRWHYAKVPPLATALSASLASDIAAAWMGNVEVKGGLEFSPFETKITGEWPPARASVSESGRIVARSASADPTIQPSVAKAMQDNSRTREDVTAWISPSQRATESGLWQTASRGVYWAWVRGRLPFKTPVIQGASSLIAGIAANRLANLAWGGLFSGQKISGKAVKAAALGVENAVARLIQTKYYNILG